MANCIKDKSQIECEKRLEELTKKSIYKGLKALKKNIKKKKKSTNLILVEWDINYDDTCSCLNEIIRYFTINYKDYHCLLVLYDNKNNYYYVHETVELNDLLNDYYHIALEMVDHNRWKLKKINNYKEFKLEIYNKYKKIITCTPKYYKVPELEFIRNVMRENFEMVCNIK